MINSSTLQSKIISINILLFIFCLLFTPMIAKADYCNVSGAIIIDFDRHECDSRGGTYRAGDPPVETQATTNETGDTGSGDQSQEYFKGKTIGVYITSIYKYGISVVGILATIVIMIGGLIWITSMGNASRVSNAKDWIGAALTGLALAMFSYTLLFIINPDLVELKPLNPESAEAISANKKMSLPNSPEDVLGGDPSSNELCGARGQTPCNGNVCEVGFTAVPMGQGVWRCGPDDISPVLSGCCQVGGMISTCYNTTEGCGGGEVMHEGGTCVSDSCE